MTPEPDSESADDTDERYPADIGTDELLIVTDEVAECDEDTEPDR